MSTIEKELIIPVRPSIANFIDGTRGMTIHICTPYRNNSIYGEERVRSVRELAVMVHWESSQVCLGSCSTFTLYSVNSSYRLPILFITYPQVESTQKMMNAFRRTIWTKFNAYICDIKYKDYSYISGKFGELRFHFVLYKTSIKARKTWGSSSSKVTPPTNSKDRMVVILSSYD